jgi:cyanophycin synthetase
MSATPTPGAPALRVAGSRVLAAGNIFAAAPAAAVALAGAQGGWPARLAQAWRDVPRRLPGFPADPPASLPRDSAAAAVCLLAGALRKAAGLPPARLILDPGGPGQEEAILAGPRPEASLEALLAAALMLGAGQASAGAERVQQLLRLARADSDWTASAARLGIPCQAFPGTRSGIVALGQGHRRQLFWRHITPATPHIGTAASTNKAIASAILRQAGLPVPANRLVRNRAEAVAAAREMGWPLVVKPATTDFGTAVTTRIRDAATLDRALRLAAPHGPSLVEAHVEGDNHRILVFRDRCLGAVRQTPAHVTGDGVRSVRDLVDATNATRSDGLSSDWKKITVDEGALGVLADQRLGLDSVPERGRVVNLRWHSNLSVGGTMEDVTARLHPDVAELAVRAAAVLGLDLAGVDFITRDCTRSWLEVGGGIAEVNASPGFVMGEPEEALTDRILDSFFPRPSRGWVPAACVLAEGGDAARTAAGLARLLRPDPARVALVAAETGVRLGEHRIHGPAAETATLVAAALAHHRTEALVVTASGGDLRRSGLGLERCGLVVAGADGGAVDMRALARMAEQAAVVVVPAAAAARLARPARARPAIWVFGREAPPPGIAVAGQAWMEGDAAFVLRRGEETPRRLGAATKLDEAVLACAAALGRLA